MSFTQSKLVKSINQSSGIFDKFIYSPENGDSISDILSSGYFSKSRFLSDDDWLGAYVDVNASDGYALVFIDQSGNATNALSGLVSNITNLEIGRFSTSISQNPTGLGEAGKVTIKYGVGGDTDGGEFTVNSDGIVTANMNSTQYELQIILRIGRSGAAGVSVMMARFMYAEDGVLANGVQVGDTFSVKIDDGDTTWREVFDIKFSPAVGSKTWFELARDDSGNNSGGLLVQQPTSTLLAAGWSQSNSASLQIRKTVAG